MAITKKPKNLNLENIKGVENKAEAFIAAAGKSVKSKKRENKKPIMIRFDPILLDKVDVAALRRGVSRSSWIQYVISKAIDNGDV